MKIKILLTFVLAISLLSACKNTNADVIDIHGNVSNLYKMDDFVKSVKAHENTSIRISHYTVEGDPIYHNIKYLSDKFELQYDTTHDKFGVGKVTTYSCGNFEKTETNTEMKYTLNGCSGEAKNIDVLYISYDVSKQDLFEFQLKYGDNQTNEINTIDRQNIYKKMVLSNFLSEKKFATCSQKPNYYLKVKINSAVREYNWSDCPNSEDNKVMTDLANTIILSGNR
jgi:hypothetical protein